MGNRAPSAANELDRLHRRLAELETENERLRVVLRQAGMLRARAAADAGRAEGRHGGGKIDRERDFTHLITDNAAEALFLMDEAGRVIFANPAGERLVGRPREELLGCVLHDVVHRHDPEGRPHPAECPLVGMLVSGRIVEGHEDLFFHKNGTSIDVACSNTPIFQDGDVAGSVLVVHDTTRRKRAEAALHESEARLRFALEAGRLGSWELDLATGIIVRSPRHDRIFGYEELQAEWTYKIFLQHILPEDRDEVDRKYRIVVATGQPWSFECRIRRRDGELRWIDVSGMPLEDVGGKVTRLIGVVQDVTDRKRPEEALREREERLRLALDAGRLGEWDWDLEAGTAVQSLRTYQIYGYDEPLPEFTYEIFLEHVLPEDHDEVDRNIREAIESGGPLHFQCRIRRMDGELRWIEVSGRPLQGAGGKASRMIGVLEDITDRKRAEKRQAVLIRELHHRVKNMLAIVQSVAQLTTRQGVSIKAFRASFQERIAALSKAQDLLTTGDRDSASLADIVRAALAPYDDEFGSHIAVEGENVQIGPGAAVTLSMAFHELATNAAKYGALSVPTGRVAVSWSVHRAADGRQVRLTWIETGGPKVVRPSRKGFGSKLVERLLARELDGEARLDFEPAGVRFTMNFPLRIEAG